MNYHDFLAQKAISDPMTGLANVPDLPECLFPHQRDIVAWALRRGRAALFAGTGLGKSLMELAWAEAVHNATGKDILHLAPPPVDPVKEYFDELAYKLWTPEIAADELLQALPKAGWEVKPKETDG